MRKHGDGWQVVGDLAAVPLPPTITGLLEARLDRLSPDERAVIERASVEGRVFHWGSVTALSSDLLPEDVSRHLRALVRRDLIGPDEAVFGGSEAFRFRHALIRDAAYERMPKETRADLHERHAAWLEEVAGEHAVEFEEVLAYHLEQAYRLAVRARAGRRTRSRARRRGRPPSLVERPSRDGSRRRGGGEQLARPRRGAPRTGGPGPCRTS